MGRGAATSGHDLIPWVLNPGTHGPEFGLNAFRVAILHFPAAAFRQQPAALRAPMAAMPSA